MSEFEPGSYCSDYFMIAADFCCSRAELKPKLQKAFPLAPRRFGFGDPTSYTIVEQLVVATLGLKEAFESPVGFRFKGPA